MTETNKYNGIYKFAKEGSIVLVKNGKYKYLKQGSILTISPFNSDFYNISNKKIKELLDNASITPISESDEKELFMDFL